MHLKLLISIVDRGKGEAVASAVARDGALYHCLMLGSGMAHPDVLGLLGLTDSAKDVIVSAIRSECVPSAIRRLTKALDLTRPGHGITFTVPLSSVGGARTLEILSGSGQSSAGKEEEQPMEAPANELIVTIVNRGFSDAVMDIARGAGARGGTMVHARGAGLQNAEQFFGMVIQPEKEMLLIVVPKEDKLPVMQAIVKGAGLHMPGKGIVFSLPVTEVMGMSTATDFIDE